MWTRIVPATIAALCAALFAETYSASAAATAAATDPAPAAATTAVVPGPAPAAAATVAAAATAATSGASSGIADGALDGPGYLMADFEGKDPLRTPLKGYWYFFDDRYLPSYPNDNIPGNSAYTTFDATGRPLLDSAGGFDTASFPTGRGGEAGTRSLRFGYELGTRPLSCGGSCTFDPFVAFGLIFATTPDTLDLSSATAISFWARSDSDTVRADVSVGTRDSVAEAPDYAQAVAVGPAWSRFSIRLRASGEFKQPERGPRKPFVSSRVYGLLFSISRGPDAGAPANALRVDDVTIDDWIYPPAPDGLLRPGLRARAHAPYAYRLPGTPTLRVPKGTVFPCFDVRGRAMPWR